MLHFESRELKRLSWVVKSAASGGAGADEGEVPEEPSFSSSVIRLELTEGLGLLMPLNSLPPSNTAASRCSMEMDLLRGRLVG